ncbi:MAG: alpha/beta hydrolase [Desulfatibacillaceae bacterium]|nr:alpha/beta hydrolase [Desulfatibacillaceae bacterium]
MTKISPKALVASVGDVDIQYLLYPGKGMPIVFLHATGFMPWIWDPIARQLAGDHMVIAPYFCDHRSADPEQGGLAWHILAKDIAGLFDKLALEKPFVVGHSMGAVIAALSEANYGPRASGMLLIEPIFLPQEFYGVKIGVNDHPLASKSIRRRNHWDSEEEAKDYLRKKPLFASWDEEMLDLYIARGMKPDDNNGLTLVCTPVREASLFMGSVITDPWPLLQKVSCPTLLAEGEKSENRAFIDLKKAAAMLPKGRYRLIEGAGHLIPMERPRATASLVKELVEQAAAPAK